MSDSNHTVQVFKGLVMLTQGILLFVLMTILINLSAVGLETTAVNEIVGPLRLLEFQYLYKSLQIGGLVMTTVGPVWYWFGSPLYSYFIAWMRDRETQSQSTSLD